MGLMFMAYVLYSIHLNHKTKKNIYVNVINEESYEKYVRLMRFLQTGLKYFATRHLSLQQKYTYYVRFWAFIEYCISTAKHRAAVASTHYLKATVLHCATEAC